MARNLKRKRLEGYLITLIKHDFGFYNPKWEWDILPSDIRDNYVLLKGILDEWEAKGHIKIYEENGKRILEVISIPE